MLRWLEFSSVALWVHESWGFLVVLTLDAFGTLVVIGVALIVALRVSGAFSPIPLPPLRRLLPFIWFGVGLQVSGCILLSFAQPDRYLSYTFDLKLALVVIGCATAMYVGRTLHRVADMSSRNVILAIVATAVAAFIFLALDQAATLEGAYMGQGYGEAFSHLGYPTWIKVVHGLIGLAVLSTLALLALRQRAAFLFAWAAFLALVLVGLLGVYQFRTFEYGSTFEYGIPTSAGMIVVSLLINGTPTSVDAVLLSLLIALLATHWRQIGVLKPGSYSRIRAPLTAKVFILLASASLLAASHSQVVAQTDDIPDSILVTGSLIRGVKPAPNPGPFTRLSSDELRALLRGQNLTEARSDLHVYSFGCNGGWSHWGARVPEGGRYFIRRSQYCLQREGRPSHTYCVKLYRDQTGRLFMGYSSRFYRPELTEIVVTQFSPACPR